MKNLITYQEGKKLAKLNRQHVTKTVKMTKPEYGNIIIPLLNAINEINKK